MIFILRFFVVAITILVMSDASAEIMVMNLGKGKNLTTIAVYHDFKEEKESSLLILQASILKQDKSPIIFVDANWSTYIGKVNYKKCSSLVWDLGESKKLVWAASYKKKGEIEALKFPKTIQLSDLEMIANARQAHFKICSKNFSFTQKQRDEMREFVEKIRVAIAEAT